MNDYNYAYNLTTWNEGFQDLYNILIVLRITISLFILVPLISFLYHIGFLARLLEVQKSHYSPQSYVFLFPSHFVKVFRSPYLDNHLLESIHTWTIGTQYGQLSFHDLGPLGPCQGVWLEVKI